VKIAFHDNCLSIRGTTVAIFDYAYWTRKYLNIEPIIVYNKNLSTNDLHGFNKCSSEFSVFNYESFDEVDTILLNQKCDAFFAIKGGKYDGVISNEVKNFICAVSSNCTKNDIHGNVFAMGSDWLSKITGIPSVPHVVYLPNHDFDMRDELGIPRESLVFGRNGGWETFDIPFVKQSIMEVLDKRKDIWFLFQYTEPFYYHERIIYLDPNYDLNEKVKFINTCDAMIHARYIGESFGLSCAEFSIKNKPVITWYNSPERNHIDTLGEKGIYYKDKADIDHILYNIDKFEINQLEWNCYQNYSPEKVVQKFKEVYLD
jgi:hypothetical protein